MQFMTKAYEQPFLCTKGYIKNRSCFSGRPRRWTVMKMNFFLNMLGKIVEIKCTRMKQKFQR